MHDSHFLSRIIGMGGDNPDENLAASIQAHLVVLLNTRRGMIEHLPDYGLPDIHYVYYSLPKSLEILAEDIKNTVETYEPRLRKVVVKRVSQDKDVFRALYTIEAEIAEGSGISRLTFETMVYRDGRSHVALVNRYG